MKHLAGSLFFIIALFLGINHSSKALSIATGPLYLSANADPNLMFILDDSGSMQWEIMPDDFIYSYFVYPIVPTVYGGTSDYSNWVPTFESGYVYSALSRSFQINKTYYNPSITYVPWLDPATGQAMMGANPEAAPHNPMLPLKGFRNLTVENTQTAAWDRCAGQPPIGCSTVNFNQTFYPAIYFRFSGGNQWTLSNYTKIEIRSTTPLYTGDGRENRSDCTNGVCTYDQEIKNFANWYTYYRSRILSSRSGIGWAFSKQSANMRVGFGSINKSAANIDGVSTGTIINGVRPFSGANRQNFFTNLYSHAIPLSSTPLKNALNDAGKYYSRADNAGPWGASPGTNNTTAHLECRQSYTVLMTDGYWSDFILGIGNADNTNGEVIINPSTGDAYQYTPTDPYRDQWSNTLADIAMHYWKTDLRAGATALANKVPITKENPAFWQHMVTFGVGLGVHGLINPDTAWDAVATETPIAWLDPNMVSQAKLDDLLHASINGHGGFFSAADPMAFSNKLNAMLNAITERIDASSAAVTTNSTRLDTNSVVYQAKFDSRNWTGQLLAFKVNANGSLAAIPSWNAGKKLTEQDNLGRSIFSFNKTTGAGVEFYHGNVVTSLSEDKINYLRGDQTNEQPLGAFRKRIGNYALLGDIVNSDPWFIGGSNFGYHLLKPKSDGAPTQESIDYATYRSSAAYKARKPLVVVGANDGLFHAFDARVTESEGGSEVFAYAPHTLLDSMDALTNPAYTHNYFVDGPPVAGDAYFDADGDSDNEWRTVVVGTLGAGGKGVFALDTTFLSPSDPTYETAETSFTANRVLWEINSSSTDFSELGFTMGQASIVKMANGAYAAVFGNGYNSASHKSILYIVDIKTGHLIRAINTNIGTPTSKNGLSTPITVDINGDRVVDAIYAGDLQGNLWKFDVSSSNPSQWDVSFKSSGNPAPLYRARSAGNQIQPITAKPQIGKHNNGGVMVYFGTGKYFETGDHQVGSTPLVHTFYGIRDTCVKVAGDTGNCSSTFPNSNRTHLVAQNILLEDRFIMPGATEAEVNAQSIRITSDHTVDYATKRGWYMDLKLSSSTTGVGERVVSHPLLRGGRIIFTTLIPSDNACASGGTSWIMELDALTGRRLLKSPFELTGNNLINGEDLVSLLLEDGVYSINPATGKRTAVSGIQSNVGIVKTPGVISAGDVEYKYTSGSTGSMEMITESVNSSSGRQSWWQVM